MKIDLTQALAGLALFVVAYHLGKRGKAAGGVTENRVDGAGDWWTYAGMWNA